MTFIAANWKGILIGLVTALTLIQEILSLMGHGSGALTSIISFVNSFLNDLSQSPAATVVPSQTPPSAPSPAAVAASPTDTPKT